MGEKASSEGSAVCQICAAGKYVSTKGSNICFECPQGWKRAELDPPTSCKQCEMGNFCFGASHETIAVTSHVFDGNN